LIQAEVDQKWNFSVFFLKSHLLTVMVCWCVPRPEKRENSCKSLKIGQFLSIFATFYEFKSRFEKLMKSSKVVPRPEKRENS
jgi:hypothetical protein